MPKLTRMQAGKLTRQSNSMLIASIIIPAITLKTIKRIKILIICNCSQNSENAKNQNLMLA